VGVGVGCEGSSSIDYDIHPAGITKCFGIIITTTSYMKESP